MHDKAISVRRLAYAQGGLLFALTIPQNNLLFEGGFYLGLGYYLRIYGTPLQLRPIPLKSQLGF